MFIGIDLGTSSIKVVLFDENQKIIGSTFESLEIINIKNGYYEQNPENWVISAFKCFRKLKNKFQKEFRATEAIGISGQMHGATLIDKNNFILRPCILWNDSRSISQCNKIENQYPEIRKISGNIVMPGFTAPKILWVKENEPDIFNNIFKVLLPKDYLRYKLTKSYFTDMSDASGTLWLDVKERKWSDKLLELSGVNISQMPELVEGSEPTAYLSNEIKNEFGFDKKVIVAGGAGDQAAAAIGSGVVSSNESMISLGTSGVYFSPTSEFTSNTDQAVHSFCHCLPYTWHHMSVMLSATNCLNWISNTYGLKVDEAISKANIFFKNNFQINSTPYFLPYLSGERTPHNNPYLRGSFHMISTSTTIESMIYAVMEGISFGIKDGFQAVNVITKNHQKKDIYLVGGGSKSNFWGNLIASILNKPIIIGEDSELGSALGVARLAMLSTNKYKKTDIIQKMKVIQVCDSLEEIYNKLETRYQKWKLLVDTNKFIAKKILE